MTTDNKTLADVQPGGRVRLGDQAERARFEAWNRENWPNLDLSRGPLGDYMQARVRSDWQLWQAAQPSSGGQGDDSPMAKMAAALRGKAEAERAAFDQRVQSGEWGPMPDNPDVLELPPLPEEVDSVRCMIRGEKGFAEPCDYYFTSKQMRDYARTALAASQPVDPERGHIDPSWSLHDRVEFALRDAGFDLDEAAFVAEAADSASWPVEEPIAEVVVVDRVRKLRVYPDEGLRSLLQFPVGTKFYTAPPAQAVDLERFRGMVKSQHSMTEWMHRCGFVSAEKLEESKKNHDHLMALIDSQAVGEPVEHACTNCDRTDEVVICQTCAGMAWDNGRLHEFHEVRELSTSLGEGVLDHLLPDEWHEKPLLRFHGAFDEGDRSVGIGERCGNVLAADQSGTVLGDYLAARAAKEGGR